MTLIEVAKVIGDDLTQIDTRLQTPGLSDADWQTLFALRKHLDDIQRDLIQESINEADQKYQALTTQLQQASNQLATVITNLSKVSDIIATVAQVAAYADEILNVAG
jgi:septation ring formation regulator EzrA